MRRARALPKNFLTDGTAVLVLLLVLGVPARAWDYEGHRLVNLLALEALPMNFPAFAKTPAARERIAFLGGEPDRWRNTPHYPLRHQNNPEHYFDFEDLAPLELTVTNLPMFRHEFIVHVFRVRAAHPERFPAIAATNDLDRTRALPGLQPWRIAEDFARLKSSFSYLKAFEQAGGTADEIANAQANIVAQMGVMGHFVGDGAQPLHTTRNYNGWTDANPRGFTTSRGFHAWIDGGYLRKVGVSFDELRPRVTPAPVFGTAGPTPERDPAFDWAVAYLHAQFAEVIPLYELDKAGGLTGEGEAGRAGREFLLRQLLRGAEALATLWRTAWEQAPADTYLLQQLARRQAGR